MEAHDRLTKLVRFSEPAPFGKARLRFELNPSYGVAVDQVRVRHVARYQDGDNGNTYLDITMWQDTKLAAEASDGRNDKARIMKVTPSEKDDKHGLANTWYEAHFSSRHAEEIFAENETVEFGEEAQWRVKTLKEKGVFQSLYKPAVGMVEKIDDIGSTNDNGRNPFHAPAGNDRSGKPGSSRPERSSFQMDW